jgi:HEAT repeat protein
MQIGLSFNSVLRTIFAIAVLMGADWLWPRMVWADGCFVLPFKWNKQKDINEPAQKAIIFRDGRKEELILQVKYEGPASKFGWLVPVPGLPKVERGSMECFYELSRYTQEHMEPPRFRGTLGGAYYGGGAPGGKGGVEPVKVIELKTVGAYQVAVLSGQDAGSLKVWLDKNRFSAPEDRNGVLESYIKRGWYFVAVKVDLSGGPIPAVNLGGRDGQRRAQSIREQLAKGELHPLRISFESDECVFPLRISSLNNRPSEVQIYTLSSEPLVEPGMFERKLRELQAKNEQVDMEIAVEEARSIELTPQYRLVGEFDPPDRPFPRNWIEVERFRYKGEQTWPATFAQVSSKELPSCGKLIPGFGNRTWWLKKETWKFRPEEMCDLNFKPAIPVFAAHLGDEEGYFAALNLSFLGTNAMPALAEALHSPYDAVRARAASMVNGIAIQTGDESLSCELAEYWNDPVAEVRRQAVVAAERNWEKPRTEVMLKLLKDNDVGVRFAAAGVLSPHREELTNCLPRLLEMLRGNEPELQASASRALGNFRWPPVSQDILRHLLQTPHYNVYWYAYGGLWGMKHYCDCDDAKPLLANPKMEARILGLRILEGAGTGRAAELTLPMLRDREPTVRHEAWEVLHEITGGDIAENQPEQWEAWWEDHGKEIPKRTEQDLVEYVREIAAHYRGHYPPMFPDRIYPGYELLKFVQSRQKPERERTVEERRGLKFYHLHGRMAQFLQQNGLADRFWFVGMGVKPGESEKVVCCYKLDRASTYRAVYADMSVRDVTVEQLPPLEKYDGSGWKRIRFDY